MLLLLPPTKSVLKQKEIPSTVSSFYVSVLYTAMLRTSIAAVVLGCFYFCALHCDASVMVVDCAAVETGCMLEKYIPGTWYLVKVATKNVFFFFLVEVLLLLLMRAAAAAHNISTEAERGTGYCFLLLRLRYNYCCFLCVYSIDVAAVEKGCMPEKANKILLFLFWWLRCCCFSLIERDVLKKMRLVFAFCLIRERHQSR